MAYRRRLRRRIPPRPPVCSGANSLTSERSQACDAVTLLGCHHRIPESRQRSISKAQPTDVEPPLADRSLAARRTRVSERSLTSRPDGPARSGTSMGAASCREAVHRQPSSRVPLGAMLHMLPKRPPVARSLALDGLAKECAGGGNVTSWAETDVNGVASAINRPIEPDPFGASLRAGLVYTPRHSGGMHKAVPTSSDHRGVMVQPAHDRGVGDRAATLAHHLQEVPQLELEAPIPRHAESDDLAIEVPTFEQLLRTQEPIYGACPQTRAFARRMRDCTRVVPEPRLFRSSTPAPRPPPVPAMPAGYECLLMIRLKLMTTASTRITMLPAPTTSSAT